MNRDNKLINVFNNTIEALEEYIEKIGYPSFKKQIFDKSINSPDRSPEDLADDFLTQLYCLKAMVWVIRKKPEYSRQEVQKIFYQWIEVAGIKSGNCPKDLKHYLNTINEVLENRGESFVQQTDEKNNSGKKPDSKDLQKFYNLYDQELRHPSEKKEVNIQGNAETGKEIFQQIVSSLPDSDRQNFRFYTSLPAQNRKSQQEKEPKGYGIILFGIVIVSIAIAVSILIINKKRKKK